MQEHLILSHQLNQILGVTIKCEIDNLSFIYNDVNFTIYAKRSQGNLPKPGTDKYLWNLYIGPRGSRIQKASELSAKELLILMTRIHELVKQMDSTVS